MANPMDLDQDSSNQEKHFALRAGLNFDVLWYADEEARQIEQLSNNVKVYKREDATKDSFFANAPNCQTLHFATHAFSDTLFDAFSGLVLACGSDSSDDGFLMGYEISDVDLSKCELVTLSACESGRGQLVKGEGLLGLPRSFLAAGADRVLMTLWKVDDRYSSMLMTKFYDNFINKGLQQAEALNQAKKSFFTENEGASNYLHPFFWASYTLYGKPDIAKQSNVLFKVGLIVIILIVVSIFIRFSIRKNLNTK
jgi:CHAT domain-containing protein